MISELQKAVVPVGARTLEGEHYTSGQVFDLESERIFAREWLCVGRREQIPGPGSYFLAEIAGESLIVLRDSDGRARAHFNVCRHRGARMVSETAGSFSKSIQCPYHAWTYALDGRLSAARCMAEVEDFDKAEYPLHSASLVEWDGFLMVNLDRNPAPFELAFAPLIGKFSAWNLAGLKTARTIEYDLAANWKLIFQNYSECYHCPMIHPRLAQLSDFDSGTNDLVDGPFLGGPMEISRAGGGMSLSGEMVCPPISGLDSADLQRVYYYTIFPNLLLSLHAEYVMVHRLLPIAPDRTKIVCEWLFEPSSLESGKIDDAVEFWDLTNREDWHACEITQQGVYSRRYTPGPYAHYEGMLYAFDQHYLAVTEPGCRGE